MSTVSFPDPCTDKARQSGSEQSVFHRKEKGGKMLGQPQTVVCFFCVYSTTNATDPTSSVSSCLRKFILYIMSSTDRTFGQKKPFALLPPYASFSFIPRQCPYVQAYSVQSYSKRTVTLPPHVSFLKSLWEPPFHARKQISWKSHGLSKKSQIREGDVR